MSDHRGHVFDVGKGSCLHPISKNRHRLSLHNLVHEDTNDIAIFVTDILSLPVDIMGSKDNIVQSKEFVTDSQFLFNSLFGNAVGIHGHRNHIFSHGTRVMTINGDRRTKYKTLNVMIDCGID